MTIAKYLDGKFFVYKYFGGEQTFTFKYKSEDRIVISDEMKTELHSIHSATDFIRKWDEVLFKELLDLYPEEFI